MLVVFGVVVLALVLFATELLPIDVTALLVAVVLMVLGPLTDITVQEGLSGFSNPATITVLAMLILSAGVSKTGAVQILGRRMARFAGTDRRRQLAATIGVTSISSGFINNTPVVAILVPVVSDIAHKGKTSPSKLLMPLSFASMLGGMLTLIGTSTNILASSTVASLGQQEEYAGLGLRAFTVFEFTDIGLLVLAVGSVYLMTIGYRLTPERVPPEEGYVEEYEIEGFLTDVVVDADSPLTGMPVSRAVDERLFDADILQLERGGERFSEPLGKKEIQPGDTLRIRADRNTLRRFMLADGLSLLGGPRTDAELTETDEGIDPALVEVVVPRGSFLVGETLASSTFRQRYDANVLAFRSRGELIRNRLEDITIQVGDTLLVQTTPDSLDRLAENRDFIVAREPEQPSYRTEKIPLAVGIVLAVVGVAALGLLDIVVSALAGVVAMLVTGVIRPNEVYESVEWNVVFLLAGVIPLGIALQNTGGAQLLGALVALTGNYLPAIGVLWVFYVATSLITNVISNNASVVLMIPVAVDAAVRVGASPFAFVLAVTFAASTAFLSPVGYQTNLFIYGPGGYRFTDYARVGGLLQLVLSVVTVVGIVVFRGLTV
ncbi:SLC13 family permease [Halomarina oriensis]|uniref:SLC13 family permease n=1 Tax=Halomarina oriensis TaxID=671145 RepID=A0A6B0GSJ2_9EURY|nr:SLC13 family permease [Halomarina oriensis]MWG36669.1 SLC13 family permease [Halomarina oriensis]